MTEQPLSPEAYFLQLSSLLIDLECTLRNARLWAEQAPANEALVSTQPFCVDTLPFEQWLQFVFLPRAYQLVESGQGFPGKCDISPMAEHAFAGREGLFDLLQVLRAIDELSHNS